MGNTPSYLTNLKKLGDATPTLAENNALEDELFRNPSDRAAVVMLSTLLESALEAFLLAHMRENLKKTELDALFGTRGGLLASFGGKITVAYSMRLIGPKTKHDLDLVRRIRDTFAHARLPITFSTAQITEACKHFQVVDLPETLIPYKSLELAAEENLADAVSKANPKNRFITTCHAIAARMFSVRTPNRNPLAGTHAWIEPLP